MSFVNGKLRGVSTVSSSSGLYAGLDPDIVTFNNRLSAVETQSTALTSSVSSLVTNVNVNTADVVTLKAWRTANETNIASIPTTQSDVSTLKTWRTANETNITSIPTLTISTSNLNTRLQTVENTLGNATTSISTTRDLVTDLVTWRNSNGTNIASIPTIQSDVSTLRSWRTANETNIASIPTIRNDVTTLRTWRTANEANIAAIPQIRVDIEDGKEQDYDLWRTISSFITPRNSIQFTRISTGTRDASVGDFIFNPSIDSTSIFQRGVDNVGIEQQSMFNVLVPGLYRFTLNLQSSLSNATVLLHQIQSARSRNGSSGGSGGQFLNTFGRAPGGDWDWTNPNIAQVVANPTFSEFGVASATGLISCTRKFGMPDLFKLSIPGTSNHTLSGELSFTLMKPFLYRQQLGVLSIALRTLHAVNVTFREAFSGATNPRYGTTTESAFSWNSGGLYNHPRPIALPNSSFPNDFVESSITQLTGWVRFPSSGYFSLRWNTDDFAIGWIGDQTAAVNVPRQSDVETNITIFGDSSLWQPIMVTQYNFNSFNGFRVEYKLDSEPVSAYVRFSGNNIAIRTYE
jgi:hypothetical protein